MKLLLQIMILVSVVGAGFIACGKNSDGQPVVVPVPTPVPPAAPQCQQGQNCNVGLTCPAGQYISNNQCVVISTPAGYQHLVTNLVGVSSSISQKIIEVYYGYCIGFGNFCPNKGQSTLELKLYGSGQAMTPNVYLYVGSQAVNYGGTVGFVNPVITISGQAQHFVINSDKGSEIMLQHAGWKFNIRTKDYRMDNPGANPLTSIPVEVDFTDVLKTTATPYGTGTLTAQPQ